MKIAYTIVRILMGLLFIFASITYFLNLIQPPEMTGNMKEFNEGLAASGYFMTLLKITELVCGIALSAGYFVPLVTVILAPIIINIFFVHLFLDRTGLPVAIFLILGNVFLAYYNWEKYEPLLQPK